jgi:hypothetical protein
MNIYDYFGEDSLAPESPGQKMSNVRDQYLGDRYRSRTTSDHRENVITRANHHHDDNKHWSPSDVAETGLIDREQL